jgi:rod shape-determining protein MreC
MEFFLNRYRNLSVLLVAILAQLALLAYQVKSNQDVRLIRVWAVGSVTPLARVIEAGRSGISRFFSDYFVLLHVRSDNERLRADLDRTEMENQYLRAQLDTADRAHALAIFQASSPSKTVAAHIIGTTTDQGAKAVIVDRGAGSGIQKDMAVITPDGIVGKVINVYSTASYVLLITDPNFAAGVVSQRHHVHGTLRGLGQSNVMIDHVQNEEPVDPGEWFYTSGDDLIFPRGLPVGQVAVVQPGRNRKEIYVTPSGLQNGLEEVLIVVQGVHQPIPDLPLPNQQVHLLVPPPTPSGGPAANDSPASDSAQSGLQSTDADRLLERYRAIGIAEHHVYGDRGNGAPNYNVTLAPAPAAPAPAPPDRGTAPAAVPPSGSVPPSSSAPSPVPPHP